MSSVGELREAMHTFDPGWNLDLDQVRATAARARRRRRLRTTAGWALALAGVVAGTGAVYAKVQPLGYGSPARPGGTNASIEASREAGPTPSVPPSRATSLPPLSALKTAPSSPRAGASLSGRTRQQLSDLPTIPKVRTSAPPPLKGGGATIPIDWQNAAVQVTLISVRGAVSNDEPPSFCTFGPSGRIDETVDMDSTCMLVDRDRDGWLAQRSWKDREWWRRNGIRPTEAPRVWVIETPLAEAIVSRDGVEVPTMIHDLGSGYLAVTALLPLDEEGMFLPGVEAWAFDNFGELVAYSSA